MDREEFLKDYYKHRVVSYYKKFWANVAHDNGLTISMPDGTICLIKINELTCNDLGSMCGQCVCGHAIRYEYWFGEIGPIGSTCIQTMTGLKDEDLRKLIRGSELAKKDKKDLESKLELLGTLENQLESSPHFKQKLDLIQEAKLIPEGVKPFIENNIPMPWEIMNEVYKEAEKLGKVNTIRDKFGETTYQNYISYQSICHDLENTMLSAGFTEDQVLKQDNIISTLKDLGEKLSKGHVSDKQVNFFNNLITKAQNDKFADAIYVLIKLSKEDLPTFWADIVKENIDKALKYGLSENQTKFILEQSSTGKPGLAIRFKEKLDPKHEVEDKPETESEEQIIEDENNLDFTLDMPE